MKLSIIIVNYNVRHFLEHCLASVSRAIKSIDAEIIVVDNASVDDSVDMVKNQFPQVHLISSPQNLGFAKANNLAAGFAKGDYIALLNPDTVVEEDCYIKCLNFMDSHVDSGALGVKLIDGSGKFLPESKRGFPGLWNSFCKMSGLYRLFPKSGFLNGYYCGNLDMNSIHTVDVLSGAFMLIRKKVWHQIGGLDEAYFMYGEDIDFSYQVINAGFKNYYFPDVSIIHYKGESTSKSSVNYIISFYKAMIIFTRKHFIGSNKFILLGLLSIIVWIKAFLSAIQLQLSKFRNVFADLVAFALGFYLIRYSWASWYHNDPVYLNTQATLINLAVFVLVWLGCFFFQGVYEKKFSLKDLIIAAIYGFIINLVIYALLPENWRASRMLLILSFLWVVSYSLLSRLVLNRIRVKAWIIGSDRQKNVLVLGDSSQLHKANTLLKQKKTTFHCLQKEPREINKFQLQQWVDLIRIQKIEEIIFCQKNLDWKQILDLMKNLNDRVEFKIMTESSAGIIGSSSRHNRGEIYSLDLEYNLAQRVFIRQKRLFDFLFSTLLFCFSWLLIFVFNSKKQFMLNVMQVMSGQLTWVSYQKQEAPKSNLPYIKPGILYPVPASEHILSAEFEEQLLSMYAWNYSVWTDLEICLRDFHKLDQPAYGYNG